MNAFALRLSCVAVVFCVGPMPAIAQVCTGSQVGFASEAGIDDRPANCVNLFFCYPPVLEGVQYETLNGCDPEATVCSVRAVVPGTFPSARKNTLSLGFFDSPVKLLWTDAGSTLVGACGNLGARIAVDRGKTWITGGNFSCADPGAMTGAGEYTLEAVVCDGVSGCEERRTTQVPLTPEILAALLCEPAPPMNCDSGDRDCETCLGGGASGGASVGGGGPGMGAPSMGPGAELVYQAGGTGNPELPRPPLCQCM